MVGFDAVHGASGQGWWVWGLVGWGFGVLVVVVVGIVLVNVPQNKHWRPQLRYNAADLMKAKLLMKFLILATV